MTTHRHNGRVQLECDHPDCKITTETYDKQHWRIMMDDAKRAGWVTFKRDGEWKNFCEWFHSGKNTTPRLSGMECIHNWRPDGSCHWCDETQQENGSE